MTVVVVGRCATVGLVVVGTTFGELVVVVTGTRVVIGEVVGRAVVVGFGTVVGTIFGAVVMTTIGGVVMGRGTAVVGRTGSVEGALAGVTEALPRDPKVRMARPANPAIGFIAFTVPSTMFSANGWRLASVVAL